MIAQEMHLENEDGPLLIPPPKYKRRKVYANREFPCGCGPNARQITIPANVEKVEGTKEGLDLKDEDACQEYGDHETNGKGLSEDLVEGRGLDFTISGSGVQMEASRNAELQNLSFGNNDTLREIQSVEKRSLLQGEKHNSSDLNPADVTKTKKLEEGTWAHLHLLPNLLMPSTIVWKEPKYPPERGVSAVRDFPAKCTRSVSRLRQTEYNQVVQGETDTDVNEACIVSKNTGKLDDDIVLVDEKESGTDECVAARMFVLEILSGIKQQDKVSVDNKDDQREKVVERSGSGAESNGKDIETSLEELDQDSFVYGEDALKKTRCAGVSSSKIELQGEFGAGSGVPKGVVVLGLTSAASCPWRQGRGLAKSSSSQITIKESRRKNNGSNGRDKSKSSLPKGNRSAKQSAENSMVMVSCYEDKQIETDSEASGVCTPLAVSYDEDSSENEELSYFQFLPRKGDWDITLPPSLASTSGDKSARSKVRETLRLFQVVMRKLLQEEETKSRDKGKTGKCMHLLAASVLRVNDRYINTDKVIGAVPGVEVGDIFSYRIELAIVGLHTPLQSGIETMRLGKKSVATSVVASGGYDNGMDGSDVLIYTGQGGNPSGPDKQREDQKLDRGNLALKNSIDEKNPVRVIRGFKETKPADSADVRSKRIVTYTYDGLYSVERYWSDLDHHGKLVYKFELRRIPGQNELTWKEVKQLRKFEARQGRCVDDISQGKEKLPFCAVNTVDDEQPPLFTYIATMMYPDWCTPIPLKGCDCKDGCSDSELCACTIKNDGEIPYNLSGAIVEAKPLVHECGQSCKCPPSCSNRVSQHGIKLPLEIFKTKSMGWGVRCLSFISSGSFICEYLGELLDDKEAEQRTGSDEYLFDIGRNYKDPTLTDGVSIAVPDMASTASNIVENIGFTIDAAKYGNIGRFINHSCSPNLYAQDVLFDHEDKRIPHIMFFAADNIPPLQELTYDYNYTIDQVFDEQGKIKRKDCYCGSTECTGRMY